MPNLKDYNLTEIVESTLNSYLECAIWEYCKNLSYRDAECDLMKLNLSVDDFSQDAIKRAKDDIALFLESVFKNQKATQALTKLLKDFDFQHLGHHLWLTRNSYNVGFLELGGFPLLTMCAKELKEVNLYLSSNNEIEFV